MGNKWPSASLVDISYVLLTACGWEGNFSLVSLTFNLANGKMLKTKCNFTDMRNSYYCMYYHNLSFHFSVGSWKTVVYAMIPIRKDSCLGLYGLLYLMFPSNSDSTCVLTKGYLDGSGCVIFLSEREHRDQSCYSADPVLSEWGGHNKTSFGFTDHRLSHLLGLTQFGGDCDWWKFILLWFGHVSQTSA